VLEELSQIARKLGRFDAEDSLVHMLASLVTASREFIGEPISRATHYSSTMPVVIWSDCET